MTSEQPIFKIENLQKHFRQNEGLVSSFLGRDDKSVQAVDGVDLTLYENDSQSVIGESGCGKTTLLETLIGLHEPTAGEIIFKGKKMSDFGRSDWRSFRSDTQLIFQDPFNSLDPKMTVAETLREPLEIHNMADRDQRISEVCERVELNPPDQYLSRRPNELSGGEKQRVSIARALIVEPELLLADEPVSMLDVSTQASILNLLSRLIDETGISLLYISHDLSTVSYICRRINVMYLGRIVESAATKELITEPKHPYSQALINAIPEINPDAERTRTEMEGAPPDPIGIGTGCRFRDRCPERMDICEQTPAFMEVENEWQTACHLYNEEARGEADVHE